MGRRGWEARQRPLPVPCCRTPPITLPVHPLPSAGYGMSLAYLETLAYLPWSRFSVTRQPQRPAPAATGDDDGEGEGGGGGAAQAGAPWATPSPPQLPLAAVRQRLDEAHYGLEKIKERIVQYVAVQRLRWVRGWLGGWVGRAVEKSNSWTTVGQRQ